MTSEAPTTGKTVLVTGSTDGIGRQTAVELAARIRGERARLERESRAHVWGILAGLAALE
ncbi:MAG: hypothetical protein NTX16_09300 [Actinobacteria bacterium]|nr:hypothetical protein [Actinomycetota bacterium]